MDFDTNWKERLAEGLAKRRAQLEGNLLREAKPTVFEEKSVSGSRKVTFADVTEAYECRGEYLHYDDGDDLYWTYVNGSIASCALGGYHSALSDLNRLYGARARIGGLKNEWSVNTEEFFRLREMLSIRFYTYVSVVGAAHSNHYIRTLNFFGRDAGSLSIKQLLGHSTERARRVISYCESVIVAAFEGEVDKDSFFKDHKENDQQLWWVLEHFGFDKKGLTFNFSPYAILAYAFGSHEVHVPWRLLNIADEYRDIVEKLTR